MSLDLCFWKSPPPETAADGYQLYSAMADGNWQLAEAAPEVLAFRRALIAAHPTWVDAAIEPLETDEGHDRYVLLRLPPNIPQSTVDEIKSLAEDHWLVTFDPRAHDGTGDASDDDRAQRQGPPPSVQVLYAYKDDWFVDILRKHGRPVDPPAE